MPYLDLTEVKLDVSLILWTQETPYSNSSEFFQIRRKP